MSPSTQGVKLVEKIGIHASDTVAITGAGGKTSIMFHLCEELRGSDARVLATTTTKMFYPEDFAGDIIVDEDVSHVVRSFCATRREPLFAAARCIEGGKVAGFDASAIDWISEQSGDALLLVEADGAARKPYKFYRAHEPVLPSASTHVVHVIGAEVLGAAMSAELFHRCPDAYTGRVFDLELFVTAMEWFCREKLAGFAGARTLIVNKADEGRKRAAEAMCEAAGPYFDVCMAVSLKEGEW